MQLSLRPYVTTGVALVGATVIAAAPMQPVVPADLQIANPVAQVEQAVELTANEIQNAVNQLVFAATKAGVSVAQLTTPLVAQILRDSRTGCGGISSHRHHRASWSADQRHRGYRHRPSAHRRLRRH